MSCYTCPSANSSFHLGKHLCCGDSFCQKSLNLSAPRDSMSAHSLRSPATCDNRKVSRFLEQNKAQDSSTAANGRFSESCFAAAPTTPMLSHLWRIASQPTRSWDTSSASTRHANNSNWANASNAEMQLCKSPEAGLNQPGKSSNVMRTEKYCKHSGRNGAPAGSHQHPRPAA